MKSKIYKAEAGQVLFSLIPYTVGIIANSLSFYIIFFSLDIEHIGILAVFGHKLPVFKVVD